jgi:hypothetical protein
VEGGRVLGDWPGPGAFALYENRDLQPTTGLDTLVASAAGECFGIEPGRVARALFPACPRQAPCRDCCAPSGGVRLAAASAAAVACGHGTGKAGSDAGVAGREVVVTSPDKLLIPEARVRKRDLVDYYLAVAEGALRGRRRAGPVCWCAIRTARRRVLLPEAGAGEAAGLAGSGGDPASHPVALQKESCRGMRPTWRGWPTSRAWNCIRIRCARRTWTIPMSFRVTSTPVPGIEWPQIAEVAKVAHAVLADLGLHRLAEDLRFARHPRAGAHPAALDFRRSAARGAGLAREVERRAPELATQQVVEGRAPRRVRRLQPEREGPHRGLGLLGAAEAGCAGVGAAALGRAGRLQPADFTLWTMPERFARWAIRTRPSTSSRIAGAAAGAGANRRGRATRPGRRTTPRPPASRGARRPRPRARRRR